MEGPSEVLAHPAKVGRLREGPQMDPLHLRAQSSPADSSGWLQEVSISDLLEAPLLVMLKEKNREDC